MKSTVQMVGLNLPVRSVDAEAVRAIYWSRASVAARVVAVTAANFSAERAKDRLTSFDINERDIVWSALQNLLCELSAIQKCMCSGLAFNLASKVH